MYLDHFGLNEPPFRITPVTEFFFSGANRGEILDALIYSICEVEGIVKVSGEVGSGKTMLCRMLLQKLPRHIETIYLANPSLSREEMLYAIADGLGLNINGERVGVIMQNIQNRLEEKAREGKRIVVLVDEAHAMPPDTLEELRLLYNLQAGNAKLLQLILFGQPELNAKLNQPNMRQLKDRIVHHFHMQPLSRNNLESYLMFRMRAANYHGPNVFSPNAVKLISRASLGLMRRVNILADKSLLAAFIENTHNIETRHVQAAMRDSELKPARSLLDHWKLAGGMTATFLVAGLVAWWVLDDPQVPPHSVSTDSVLSESQSVLPATHPAEMPQTQPAPLHPISPQRVAAQPAVEPSGEATAPPAGPARGSRPPAPSPLQQPVTPVADKAPASDKTPPLPAGKASRPEGTQKGIATGAGTEPGAAHHAPAQFAEQKPGTAIHEAPDGSTPSNSSDIETAAKLEHEQTAGKTRLFEQRLEEGRRLLALNQTAASIQLFYAVPADRQRIEDLLTDAETSGHLSEIYLLPAKLGDKNGIRVLYGAYATADAARDAIQNLPDRYRHEFATSVYVF